VSLRWARRVRGVEETTAARGKFGKSGQFNCTAGTSYVLFSILHKLMF
jgi:hypothetical protein